MDQQHTTATKLAVRRYLGHIWRERGVALPALILPGIGSIFSIYAPLLVVARLLNRFHGVRFTLHDLQPYLLWFAAIWFTGEMIWRVAFFFLNRADSRIMRNLYDEALVELAQKDIGFFHDNFAGALTKKALGYGRNFENFMDTLAFNISASVIPLIFVGIILWRFSPWLIVTLIGMMALVIGIVIPITRRRKRLVNAREDASSVMAGHVADVIGNMDAVQTFAHEKFEIRRHERNVADYMHKALLSWDYHNGRIDMSISPFYVLINALGLVLAVKLGKSAASISAIFVTFNYYAYVTRVLFEFSQTYRRIESAISESAQYTALVLTPSTLREAERPRSFAVKKGEIAFQDINFTYGRGTERLFENFNLRIAPGEKVAFVGHSGAGKSTVTKLLLRFVDVEAGAVLIDSQDIATAKLHDLRSSIAYVPQEPIMFHRSILENIRYGNLKASEATVIAAAKQAHAHEFIQSLPDGYETLVGERGVKLSGGQRQRIAIARAIIKDAPILVLDEATSALDSESEKLIQAALWKLMSDRTAVVIAHRLSTIQKMDRIVVLENGVIVEQGSHTELLAHKGTYAKLWAHQSGGFIEE